MKEKNSKPTSAVDSSSATVPVADSTHQGYNQQPPLPASRGSVATVIANDASGTGNTSQPTHEHRPHGRRQKPRLRFRAKRLKRQPNKIFEEKVIRISRVTKVTKGGRQFKFSTLVVIGDLKGRVGFGTGKAREIPEAIKKAITDAQKNMITVVNVNGTVPYSVLGKFGGSRVLVKPAPNGKGIIAGGASRTIFELAGYANVYTKSFHARTKINVIRATFHALNQMKDAEFFEKLHAPDPVVLEQEKPVLRYHKPACADIKTGGTASCQSTGRRQVTGSSR